MGKIRIASETEIPKGKGIVAEVEGKEYAVFNVEGTYRVIQNFCPHRGGPLGQGKLCGETVMCPLHGWEFNVASGECLTRPGVRIASFPASLEDGEIVIEVDDSRST
jgi:nitrite reductase (NADH) small subunit/3-phenylpropionate/trans-cinnamate dioxygenase ferredoxin subunit